jgi:ribosomal protein S18 acetylase RimI-like enzyme
MSTAYFKRFRMEIDTAAARGRRLHESSHYRLVPWNEALLDAHARTKFLAFRDEIDATVFPCLGSLEGCRRLMQAIRNKAGFLPEATWLVARNRPRISQLDERIEWCGTIQGVVDRSGLGSIQNIGVTPGHRSRGLGAALIHHALTGFARQGIRRATLEVTVENTPAVRLYQRLGFRRARTIYKAVEPHADRDQSMAGDQLPLGIPSGVVASASCFAASGMASGTGASVIGAAP